jgi:hypothetical protein
MIPWALLRDLHECEEIAEQGCTTVTYPPRSAPFGDLSAWSLEIALDEVERGTVFWDAMPLIHLKEMNDVRIQQ